MSDDKQISRRIAEQLRAIAEAAEAHRAEFNQKHSTDTKDDA